MTEPGPLATPDPWNNVAEGYAEELVPFFALFARDAIALAGLPADAHVLDVAAGPGTLSLLAAPQVARVSAIDFAEAMVDLLRRRAAAAGVANVEVYAGDGQTLPFDDATFDGAFSMFGLIFFPDRAAGFRELRRVLRPGRRAVASSWAPADQVPFIAALTSVMHEFLPDMPQAPAQLPLSDVEAFRAEMVAAGFRAVEVHMVEHRRPISSVWAYWESQLRSSAPLGLLKQKLDPQTLQSLGEHIVRRLEEQFGAGPLEFTWSARLGVGTR